MLLSIIIPVYNGEKKISNCLKSLMRLEASDIEFIVVNDGSTDKTSSICEKYQERDQRFRVVNKINGGVSSARNVGIGISCGKYIGFVDADDELTTAFNEIVKTIRKFGSDFFAFKHFVQTSKNVAVQERNLFTTGINEVEALYRNFLAGIMNCVWNNIYSSSIIKDNHILFPEDMKMGEDSDFNAQYIQCCNTVYFIDEIGYKYYIDDIGSASNASKLCYLKDFMKIYSRYTEIKKIYGYTEYVFYCPYYIELVYEVLKKNRKQMLRTEKKEFKESGFYNELMKYKYKKIDQHLKKIFIKLYLLVLGIK